MNELRLLGRPQFVLEGRSVLGEMPLKGIALLGYLFVEGGAHQRENIAALLWGEVSEARAMANLRMLLYEMQRLVPGLLDAQRRTLSLSQAATGNYWSDFVEFRAGLQASSSKSLAAAVALYEGDFLSGVHVSGAPAFQEWQRSQQEYWRLRVLAALERLAAQYQEEGAWAAALDALRRLVQVEPWRETSHRELMHLLARNGRHAEALMQFERCRQLLADELGVAPAPETVALSGRIRALLNRQPPTLPVALTSFVGRRSELAQIDRLLSQPDSRLLTLVGLGGAGKTRLALHAAARQLKRFLEGVWLVKLSGETTIARMAAAIAGALDLRLNPHQPLRAQLLAHLADKELLLVLDNLEPGPAGPQLVTDILQAAPGVSMLATSWEPLRLQAEHVVQVASLSTRDPAGPYGEPADAELLFVRRAQAVRPDFSWTLGSAPAVTRICQMVGGMPLAIELAAAWTSLLSLAEIERELAGSLTLLQTDRSDVPERQRSMAAVLELAWRRLLAGEQEVLRLLSVFPATFDAAAAAVAGADRSQLASLAAKSLVLVDAGGRYALHPLLRHDAWHRLERSGQLATACAGHGRYFAELMARQAQALNGADVDDAVETISREIHNARAAWRWAVQTGDLAALKAMLEPLSSFFRLRGWFEESAESMAMAIAVARAHADHRLAAGLIARHSMALAALGTIAEGYAGSQEALAMLRRLPGDDEETRRLLALCLNVVAFLGFTPAHYRQSVALAEEALAIYSRIEDPLGLPRTRHILALGYFLLGDYDVARRHGEASLADWRELGHLHQAMYVLHELGIVVEAQGAYELAHVHYAESLNLARHFENRWANCYSRNRLGYNAYLRGDLDAALALLTETRRDAQQMHDAWNMAWAANDLGLATAAAGDLAAAEELCHEGLMLRRSIGHLWGQAVSWNAIGRVRLQADDVGGALACLREGLQLAHRIEALPLVLEAFSSVARSWIILGKVEEALPLLAIAFHHPAAHYKVRRQTEQLAAEAKLKIPALASAGGVDRLVTAVVESNSESTQTRALLS